MNQPNFKVWMPHIKQFKEVNSFDGIHCLISQLNYPQYEQLIFLQKVEIKSENGIVLYQDDLVQFRYWKGGKGGKVVCRIVWNNACGMWSLMWKDGYINNYHLTPDNYEVIGNYHQTPELFK